MAVGQFREVERSYFDLRWHLDPVATQAGVTAHDDRFGRFSPAALAPHLAALKSISAALEEAAVPSLDDEIDRTALLNDIRVTVRRLERERPQAKNPGFWLSHLLGGLHFLMLRRDRTAAEQARAVASRLEDLPAFLEDARTTLVEPVRVFVATALQVIEGGLDLVKQVAATVAERAPEQAERLAAATDAAVAALGAFTRDLWRWLETASDHFALGEDDFNSITSTCCATRRPSCGATGSISRRRSKQTSRRAPGGWTAAADGTMSWTGCGRSTPRKRRWWMHTRAR